MNSIWNIIADFGLLSGHIPPTTGEGENFVRRIVQQERFNQDQAEALDELIESIDTTFNSSINKGPVRESRDKKRRFSWKNTQAT